MTAGLWGADGAVSFNVWGQPVGQGSMRAVCVKGHARVTHNSPKALMDWRIRIGQTAAALGAAKFVGPVAVHAEFRLQRPSAHYGARGLLPSAPRVPDVTPDIDKLARALLDALTGVLFADDRQVATLVVHKAYAGRDEPAGVAVSVAGL